MANIKQQIKRNLTNEKRRVRNASFKSSMKSATKNVELAVEANKLQEAEAALVIASKKIDKAVSKGILHKNTAARKKSHLQKLVNALK